MATTTNLNSLVINYLTQAQYDSAVSGGTIDANQLYLTPESSDNIVTGTGTSGYIAKWNGTGSITNGPQIGSSTTTYLRNDGTWGTPAGTYSLPLAASGTRGGVQIGYSESGTNYAVKLSSEKMYVTVPWTDTKVTTAALTSGTTYYPILATGADTATRQIDSTLGGLKYISTAGTTSAVGTAILQLGNATASGTANNEQGVIRLYGTTAYYYDIKTESGIPTANRTIYLPSYTSTMYLTCTSTTNAVGGATTAPVYVDATGRIQAVTSIPYSLLTGIPTIPTITLNGSSTTSASFYAPTSAGTSDYVLKSNGSGAPSWTSAVLTDANVTSTAHTAATTYYLTGSTSSATATGGLNKHAAIKAYTTADSGTGGSARIDLGNTTATTSAGGKEGILRLYGTAATYYVDLKAGAPGANRTITFPNASGTVALTSDIPQVYSSTNTGGYLTMATLPIYDGTVV